MHIYYEVRIFCTYIHTEYIYLPVYNIDYIQYIYSIYTHTQKIHISIPYSSLCQGQHDLLVNNWVLLVTKKDVKLMGLFSLHIYFPCLKLDQHIVGIQ